MRKVAIALLLAAMAWMLLDSQDRSVALANKLVRDQAVFTLSDDESATLNRYLTTFFRSQDLKVDYAVNQVYRPGRLNVYIVDDTRVDGTSLSPGNAAFVPSSDILFIGSTYFSAGRYRSFGTVEDELSGKALIPLRIFAFFVIAHELGHRHAGEHALFTTLTEAQRHARESQADDYAITHLKRLYASEALRNAAGIPDSISLFTDFRGNGTTPLERIADHLGYAVSFLSDEIFDSPIPLLSSTDTHPAFFARMNNLLERLRTDAVASTDHDALRQLNMFQSIIAATNYLVARRPIEIEFDHPFQYAYLDRENLYIVGNDDMPVQIIPLNTLDQGRQYRRAAPKAQRMATVRFAWAGTDGATMSLRRDGMLRLIDTGTGATLSNRSLRTALGDNTCVKQFVVPPQPAAFTYVLSCDQGKPLVTRIDQSGEIVKKTIGDLVAMSRVCTSPKQEAAFDLNASGRPIIVTECSDGAYLHTLSDDMQLLASTRLTPSINLSARILPGDVKAVPRPVVADDASRPYRFVADLLFTNVAMYEAARDDTPAFATLVPAAHAPSERLNSPAMITSSFYLTGNRRIVNLEGGGTYLIEFGKKRIMPLRRKGLREMEQISSNTVGDWMYFKKYGNRILLFKGDDNE